MQFSLQELACWTFMKWYCFQFLWHWLFLNCLHFRVKLTFWIISSYQMLFSASSIDSLRIIIIFALYKTMNSVSFVKWTSFISVLFSTFVEQVHVINSTKTINSLEFDDQTADNLWYSDGQTQILICVVLQLIFIFNLNWPLKRMTFFNIIVASMYQNTATVQSLSWARLSSETILDKISRCWFALKILFFSQICHVY